MQIIALQLSKFAEHVAGPRQRHPWQLAKWLATVCIDRHSIVRGIVWHHWQPAREHALDGAAKIRLKPFVGLAGVLEIGTDGLSIHDIQMAGVSGASCLTCRTLPEHSDEPVARGSFPPQTPLLVVLGQIARLVHELQTSSLLRRLSADAHGLDTDERATVVRQTHLVGDPAVDAQALYTQMTCPILRVPPDHPVYTGTRCPDARIRQPCVHTERFQFIHAHRQSLEPSL